MNDDQSVETRGRQIRLEPLPPGTWGLLLGVALAVLAPLAGFLIGSIRGPGAPGAPVDPMFLSLFVGIVVGALGIVGALFFAYRLVRRFGAAADRGARDEVTAP